MIEKELLISDIFSSSSSSFLSLFFIISFVFYSFFSFLDSQRIIQALDSKKSPKYLTFIKSIDVIVIMIVAIAFHLKINQINHENKKENGPLVFNLLLSLAACYIAFYFSNYLKSEFMSDPILVSIKKKTKLLIRMLFVAFISTLCILLLMLMIFHKEQKENSEGENNKKNIENKALRAVSRGVSEILPQEKK